MSYRGPNCWKCRWYSHIKKDKSLDCYFWLVFNCQFNAFITYHAHLIKTFHITILILQSSLNYIYLIEQYLQTLLFVYHTHHCPHVSKFISKFNWCFATPGWDCVYFNDLDKHLIHLMHSFSTSIEFLRTTHIVRTKFTSYLFVCELNPLTMCKWHLKRNHKFRGWTWKD